MRAVGLAAVLAVTTSLPAQPDPAPVHAAATRGLAFLVRTQREDGSWPQSGFAPHDRIVETALSALALLAATDVPDGGPYRRPLRKAIRFLQRRTPPTGPMRVAKPRPGDWQACETWYASFAALALAEVQRRRPSALNAEVLQSLRNRLLFLQKRTGGWCHDLAPKVRYPRGFERAEYSVDLLAATNFAAAALLHIERAGVSVPAAVLQRIAAYYERLQNRDGGMQYGLEHVWAQATASEPGRTAGALMVLADLLGGAHERLMRARRYLSQRFANLAHSAGHGGAVFPLGYLAGALGCQHEGGELWRRYEKTQFPELLARQREDGSFVLSHDAWATPASHTAIAVTCLLANRANLSFARSPMRRAIDFLLASRDASRGVWDGQWGSAHVDLALTAAAASALRRRGHQDIAPQASAWLRAEIDALAQRGWRTARRSHLNYQLPLVLSCLASTPTSANLGSARRIVARLADVQWANGGWSYDDREPYPLASTTCGVLLALAIARRAGVDVPATTIQRGADYLEHCANEDGGFRYCVDPRHPILARHPDQYLASTPGTTLTVLAALAACDRQDNPAFARGKSYLQDRLPRFLESSEERHYWFHLLWGAHLLPHLDEAARRKWKETTRTALAKHQQRDGRIAWSGMAWSKGLSPAPMSDLFATAAALHLDW